MGKEIKIKNPEKVIQGRKNKQSGAIWEKKVRLDLEANGWIVDKWTNNVELGLSAKESAEMYKDESVKVPTRLIPAKPKFVYNPVMKRRIMIGNNSGFPDFLAYKNLYESNTITGVEAKSNGYLDKKEKENCRWLLRNHIFKQILIAKKKKEGRRVVVEYVDFEEKYEI